MPAGDRWPIRRRQAEPTEYRVICYRLAHFKGYFWNVDLIVSVLGDIGGNNVSRALMSIGDEVLI